MITSSYAILFHSIPASCYPHTITSSRPSLFATYRPFASLPFHFPLFLSPPVSFPTLSFHPFNLYTSKPLERHFDQCKNQQDQFSLNDLLIKVKQKY